MPERILEKMLVEDIMNLVAADAAVLGPDDSILSLLEAIIKDPRTRHVYVVDKSGVLIGSVRMNSVIRYLFPFTSFIVQRRHLGQRIPVDMSPSRVGDIMNSSPSCVQKGTTLVDAAAIMIQEQVNELPVVDEAMHVVGEVNMLEVITGYLKEEKE